MPSPLPLLVVGGFLGAGKTTLVNHWLTEAAGTGLRLAVLVNDFGAINIDAAAIAGRGSDVIELTNGCVCCSIGNDLSGALIRVLEGQRPVDAILVEASGVSDPWRIAQIALAEPQLRLAAVVVLVDASAALQLSSDPLLADTLVRQLRSADLVLLNRTDLAGAAHVKAAHEWVSMHAPATPRCEAVAATLPLDTLLQEREEAADPAASALATCSLDSPAAHADLFESWAIRPSVRYEIALLRRRLADMPAGVLRLKGTVCSTERFWWELQFAGRHLSMRKLESSCSAQAAVVAIGLGGQLPRADLDRLFTAP